MEASFDACTDGGSQYYFFHTISISVLVVSVFWFVSEIYLEEDLSCELA